MSGAYATSLLSLYHCLTVAEGIFPNWAPPGPGAEYHAAKQRAVELYAAKAMRLVDAWLEEEASAGHIAIEPVALAFDTLSGTPDRSAPTVELPKPVLVPFAQCTHLPSEESPRLSSASTVQMPTASITVALRRVPSGVELENLQARLCQRLADALTGAVDPVALVAIAGEAQMTARAAFTSRAFLVRADLAETKKKEMHGAFEKWLELSNQALGAESEALGVDFSPSQSRSQHVRVASSGAAHDFTLDADLSGKGLTEKLRVKISNGVYKAARRVGWPRQLAWQYAFNEALYARIRQRLAQALHPITIDITGERDLDDAATRFAPEYEQVIVNARRIAAWLGAHGYHKLIIARAKVTVDKRGAITTVNQNRAGEGWLQIDESFLGMASEEWFLASLGKR